MTKTEVHRHGSFSQTIQRPSLNLESDYPNVDHTLADGYQRSMRHLTGSTDKGTYTFKAEKLFLHKAKERADCQYFTLRNFTLPRFIFMIICPTYYARTMLSGRLWRDVDMKPGAVRTCQSSPNQSHSTSRLPAEMNYRSAKPSCPLTPSGYCLFIAGKISPWFDWSIVSLKQILKTGAREFWTSSLA